MKIIVALEVEGRKRELVVSGSDADFRSPLPVGEETYRFFKDGWWYEITIRETKSGLAR